MSIWFQQRVPGCRSGDFDSLQPDDILFVGHHARGQDRQRRQLHPLSDMPRLRTACAVQFHDIFYHFELSGCMGDARPRVNELYLLRAFLAYNETIQDRAFQFIPPAMGSTFAECQDAALPAGCGRVTVVEGNYEGLVLANLARKAGLRGCGIPRSPHRFCSMISPLSRPRGLARGRKRATHLRPPLRR